MRISDWSSDVCSSDLRLPFLCTRSCCAIRNSRTAIIRSSGWKNGWRGRIRHEGDHLAQSQMWDVAQDIGHPGADPRRKGRGERISAIAAKSRKAGFALKISWKLGRESGRERLDQNV